MSLEISYNQLVQRICHCKPFMLKITIREKIKKTVQRIEQLESIQTFGSEFENLGFSAIRHFLATNTTTACTKYLFHSDARKLKQTCGTTTGCQVLKNERILVYVFFTSQVSFNFVKITYWNIF